MTLHMNTRSHTGCISSPPPMNTRSHTGCISSPPPMNTHSHTGCISSLPPMNTHSHCVEHAQQSCESEPYRHHRFHFNLGGSGEERGGGVREGRRGGEEGEGRRGGEEGGRGMMLMGLCVHSHVATRTQAHHSKITAVAFELFFLFL